MSTYPSETGPRRRGRPPKIDQAQIVAAALELGLDSFSMQSIAEHLGVTTPALYSHVAGRDEVVDLVNRALLAQMSSFSTDATTWRGWLTDFAESVRLHLSGSAATLLSGSFGPADSVRVGIGEDGLRLLIDAGLTPAEAAHTMWLVYRVAVTARAGESSNLAGQVSWTERLFRIGPRPNLTATEAAQRALSTEGSYDSLAFDLDIVLDGVDRRLRARARTKKGTSR